MELLLRIIIGNSVRDAINSKLCSVSLLRRVIGIFM